MSWPNYGKSIYEDWSVEDVMPEMRLFYECTPTGFIGCDSGRMRFRVRCIECDLVLHSNTTGPTGRIEDHEKEIHKCRAWQALVQNFLDKKREFEPEEIKAIILFLRTELRCRTNLGW